MDASDDGAAELARLRADLARLEERALEREDRLSRRIAELERRVGPASAAVVREEGGARATDPRVEEEPITRRVKRPSEPTVPRASAKEHFEQAQRELAKDPE